MNQCKAVTSLFRVQILMYLTLRRATCHVSTVAAGQCHRTLQAAAGRRRTQYSNIVVSSCGSDRCHAALMWPSWLTVDRTTIHRVKIPTILLEIVSCSGMWHRIMELSFPRTFAPYFRSWERKYHRWNFRSLELSLPGAKVTWNFRSLELLLPGIFVPWNFHPCTNTRNV